MLVTCCVTSHCGFSAAINSLSVSAMLSKKEKELIAEIWESLTPVAEDIGSDALLRYVHPLLCRLLRNKVFNFTIVFKTNEILR